MGGCCGKSGAPTTKSDSEVSNPAAAEGETDFEQDLLRLERKKRCEGGATTIVTQLHYRDVVVWTKTSDGGDETHEATLSYEDRELRVTTTKTGAGAPPPAVELIRILPLLLEKGLVVAAERAAAATGDAAPPTEGESGDGAGGEGSSRGELEERENQNAASSHGAADVRNTDSESQAFS